MNPHPRLPARFVRSPRRTTQDRSTAGVVPLPLSPSAPPRLSSFLFAVAPRASAAKLAEREAAGARPAERADGAWGRRPPQIQGHALGGAAAVWLNLTLCWIDDAPGLDEGAWLLQLTRGRACRYYTVVDAIDVRQFLTGTDKR